MIPIPHRSVVAGVRAQALLLSLCVAVGCGGSAKPGQARQALFQPDAATAITGNQVVWINPQISGAPGDCLGPFTMQLEDETGTPITASSPGEPINIGSDSGSGQFFIDSLCQSPGMPAAIPAGSSTADVYYRDNVSASITVTDTNTTNAAIQLVNISAQDAGTPDAGSPANQVVWSNTIGLSGQAGQCIGPLTVQLEDSGGNPIVATNQESFTVSTANAGTGLFYADATCSNASGTTFTILAGDSSFDLYYADSNASAPWLQVTNGSGLFSTQDVTITNGPVDHLVANGFPSPIGVGVTRQLIVTAYDFYGNVAVDYTGTVSVSSSDTAATLPAPHTYGPGDSGQFAFDATFGSIGTFDLTASDGQFQDSETVQVVAANQGNAVGFQVTGFPSPQPAGNTGLVTVTAIDSGGNPAVGYTGTVFLSTTAPNGSVNGPTSFTFTSDGPQDITFVFTSVGTFDLTVVDGTNSSLTGTQSGIQIVPGDVSHFDFSIQPGTQFTAGNSNFITVLAYDSYGNLATNYTGTIAFHSTDPKGVTPGPQQFQSGAGGVSTNVEFETAGLQILQVTDTFSNVTSSSPSIDVLAASFDHLQLSGLASSATAGSVQGFQVTAVDAFGNTTPSYSGTAHFHASDALAQVPPDYAFQAVDSGTQQFAVTFVTAGQQSLTVADVGSGTVSPQANIDITSGPPTQLRVSQFPSPTVAGATHPFDLEVRDDYGNRVKNYAGTIDFTSSDARAVLPAPFTFTGAEGGEHLFSATLKTAGFQAITATEEITVPSALRVRSTTGGAQLATLTPQTNGTGISGIEGEIEVDAAAATVMTVSDFPSVTNAGATQPVGVRLFDAFGNPASGYRGTVIFSSTDPFATLPPPYTFNDLDNGSHPFSAILRSPGVQAIGARDANQTSLAAYESGITVLQVAPVIVHDALATAGLNLAYPFNARGRVTTSGGLPTGFGSCGGPPEFQVDSSTGVVSWVPTAAGPVTLCVSASNSAGSDQYSFTVQVGQPTGAAPVAHLSGTPTVGPGPLDVALDGSGSTADPSTTIVAYRWRFGDGSAPRVGASVSHRYAVAGGYQALLEVVDGFGRVAIAAQPIQVTLGSTGKPPTARIVASVYSGAGPLAVNFSCDCQPGDAAIKAWHWDTGGGTQEGASTTVTFPPGVHNVHLTVTDADGLTATDSATITVTSGGQTPPSCHLYATDPAGLAPLDVILEADVRPGSAAISQRQITLFDGSTTSESVVAKPVQDPGRYTATLSVTDANGGTCSDSVEVLALATGDVVAPHIVSAAQAAGLACEGYEYDALASGSHPLTWTLVSDSGSTPAGLTVDAQTGVVKLTASPALDAPIDATLVVENSAGQDTQTVHLDPSACRLSANVGCDASAGDLAGAIWLSPALLWFLRRRRAALR